MGAATFTASLPRSLERHRLNMNTILVITIAMGLASADVGIEYNSKVPHTSYGIPSYQFGSSSAEYNRMYGGINGDLYSFKAQGSDQGVNFDQQNPGYQSGFRSTNLSSNKGAGYQTSGGGRYHGGSTNTFSSSSANVAQPSYQFNGAVPEGGYHISNKYQTSNQYQSSAANKYNNEYYNQLQQQPPHIFKHFYVHAAPEEPEAPVYRHPITLPPPQKHYKIIFIKTPSQPVYPPQYIPVPQQNEEKTIVYVLVKKPEEPQDIVIPKVEQKPPTKPEVFFIKYNNKDDQAVINNIVNDYNKVDSVSFSSIPDGSGQYLGTQTGASGQLAQTGGSGQFTQASGSGQYTHTGGSEQFTQSTGSGQQAQFSGSGQFTQNTGSDQYKQPASTGEYPQLTDGSFVGQSGGQSTQTVSQASAGSFGSQSSGVGVATAEAVAGAVSESNGLASAGAVSSSFSSNYENPISTSQGVPYETYGPPKFRELV